ncbi:DUF2690 domain-containing protein [Streptomyces sp. NPDC002004]
MRMRRIATAAATTVLVAGAVGIAGPAQAAAGRTSCYASSCNHLNPYKTYCTGDGRAVYSAANEQGDVVHLYYSPSCRSVWAETWTRQSGDVIRVERSDGSISSSDVSDGTHSWTGMINDAGYKAHAEISDPGVSVYGVTPDF